LKLIEFECARKLTRQIVHQLNIPPIAETFTNHRKIVLDLDDKLMYANKPGIELAIIALIGVPLELILENILGAIPLIASPRNTRLPQSEPHSKTVKSS
jgi:hypothetical protein